MVTACSDGFEYDGALVRVKRQLGKNAPEELINNPVMTGAVGAQVNFTRQIGLYIEPGIAYYFDDGSDIETFRKEHPLNFNLQLGLRFSFSK